MAVLNILFCFALIAIIQIAVPNSSAKEEIRNETLEDEFIFAQIVRNIISLR